MKSDFVHLHVHSHYSLLDSTNRIDALCARANELGMRALALTDHGNMFGAVEFYKAAVDHMLKPILGCELYVAPENLSVKAVHPRGFERGFHLTVLAVNDAGYRNLSKLSSLGYTDGFYYNPRVDHDTLAAHAEGLIALSGCLSGEVSKYFLAGDEAEAVKALRRGRDIFGKENYFIEIQDHGIEDQKRLTSFLLECSAAEGIPCVATNDVHYLEADDAAAHDALLCIGTRKLIRDENRKKYHGTQFYLKSPEEMKRRFIYAQDAVERTAEIAERIEFEFQFGKHHMPIFPVPIGEGSESEFLEKRAIEGLKAKMKEIPPEYVERMKTELKVIADKGFAGYFLIVSDFIGESKRRGIPVGPGRGSAAGSLVAYGLDITEVDPIPYGLIFERFLNPEREALPDIDVDICQERREEVIAYVKERYGEDRVAQIITFGTFGAKAMIRDAARIYDLPISEAERLARLVPDQLKITLAESIASVEDLKKAASTEYAQLFTTALKLEGLARHASRHAAGIVIGDLPITEIAPLYKDPDDNIVTQFDMTSVEKLGLLKVDILGLKTLTVIRAACEACVEPLEPSVIGPYPYDDPEVYRLFSSGNTLGIFQLDSAGIRELIAKVKPSRFEDLAALIALYRPGPMGLTEDFANRKHGKTQVAYLAPQLSKILEDTYGVILYQEQVMRIAVELAGYSMAEADELRRAMGKKKHDLMAKNRDRFVKGAAQRDIEPRTANEIFNQIETFAGYGFNKSHAIAYAVIAYRTAWLKVYHPVAFMAVTLSYELGNRDKLALYAEECRRIKIGILPPHVNHSRPLFTPELRDGKSAIRCGMAAIKNVGIGACEAIVEERESGAYTSLWDFLTRVDLKRVNRRAVEALTLAGAFDGLGANRRSLVNALEEMWNRASAEQKIAGTDQISLFGDEQLSSEPTVERFDEFDNLSSHELEYLGFYLNEHPLAKAFPAARFIAPPDAAEHAKSTILGLISTVDRIFDKRGRQMCRVILESLHGRYDLLVFSSTYEKYSHLLVDGATVAVTGRIEAAGRVLADRFDAADEVEWSGTVSVRADAGADSIEEQKAALENAPSGKCAVELEIELKGRRARIKIPRRVNPRIFLEKAFDEAAIVLRPIAKNR